MAAKPPPSYKNEYIVRNLATEDVFGHLRQIELPGDHFGVTAALFVPKASLVTDRRFEPVMLVFFIHDQVKQGMDEMYSRLQNLADCSVFAPKYHGVVECTLIRNGSGEFWSSTALAFDQLSGRPLSHWFDNRDNHSSHATLIQAVSDMCSTLTKQHFVIQADDFNEVYYDDETGRCMVWDIGSNDYCHGTPCVCEVQNSRNYHEISASCYRHVFEVRHAEHDCDDKCRAHGY